MNTCPQCKLINPSDAVLCDCGYDFSTGKGGLEQRKFLYRPRVIRNIGIGLFVLSFLAPGSWKTGGDFSVGGGLVAFAYAPFLAIGSIRGFEPSLFRVLLCLGLLLSWVSNFFIFFRLPLIAALVAIVLPWSVLIFGFSMTFRFFPFYPWAFGIGLIHLSRLIEPVHKKYSRTKWT